MPLAATATAVSTGLVTRLVGSGVQRLGSLVFQKVIRIAKIESALKGVAAKSAAVQTAINDFETVVGSRYGELDQQLYNFLREIERSGIVNTMVENALIDRDSKELKRIFTDLHKKILGSDAGAPALLFEKMMKSFSVTLKELCKDKILLDAFRLYRNDLDARLDRVDLALVELTNASVKTPVSFDSLRPTFLKIAKGLQGAYRSIRVETNKGARSVDITRIYIPPKLRYRDTKSNTEKVSSISRILAGAHKRSSVLSVLEVLSARQEVAQEHLADITYNDLRLLFNHVVVLGDPGGGKSTLCQHLCHDLAKQAAASLQADSDGLTAQLQKFPIRIVLRSYEKTRTREPQLSIYEFILRDLKNHVSAESDELDNALRYLLASGSAVLAFDGLDEILATAQRRDFVDLVSSFCIQFPLCPVMVTSRLVGYDDAPLPVHFDELILEKFDDNEVLRYVIKFMKVVGGHEEKEAQKRANNFYKQTTSNAADLRRNPLMLGLMAWLFNMRGDVPSNRPEIYRECAVLMFEKWDPDRDIKANIPVNFDRLQLFSSIASKIFGHPELSAGVEAQWLEKEIKAFFQAVYENKSQAFEAAKALVAFITGRAWVMSEVGDKVFAFTHQTFLEYFFARHIDDMHDTVKEVLDLVMPKVLRREWDMVSHLSLQIKTHRNLRRQNEALDHMRLMVLDRHEPKQRAALVSFVSRSLEYLVGAESYIKAVTSIVVDYAIDSALAGDVSLWSDVAQCAQSCMERREFVREVIVKRLAGEFRRDEPDRSSVIKNAVSQYEGPGVLNPSEPQRLPADLSGNVREELKQFILARVRRSSFHAAIAWQWYGTFDKSLLLTHGIETYFNARWSHYEALDGLTLIAIAGSEMFHLGLPNRTKDQSKEVLSIIGEVGFSSAPFQRANFRLKPKDGVLELSMWERLLVHGKHSPEVSAGCLFVMMLATELQGREEEQLKSDRSRSPIVVRRSKIIQRTIEKNGLQDLTIFPKIAKTVEAKTLFK